MTLFSALYFPAPPASSLAPSFSNRPLDFYPCRMVDPSRWQATMVTAQMPCAVPNFWAVLGSPTLCLRNLCEEASLLRCCETQTSLPPIGSGPMAQPQPYTCVQAQCPLKLCCHVPYSFVPSIASMMCLCLCLSHPVQMYKYARPARQTTDLAHQRHPPPPISSFYTKIPPEPPLLDRAPPRSNVYLTPA